MAAGLNLHIERREFKYLIDRRTADAVRERIRPFCRLDAHVEHIEDHRYTIDSLYFDTPRMELFHANEQEKTHRFKLRVRTYPRSEKSPIFFEVKSRYNDVIVKDRGRAPANWADLLMSSKVVIPGGRTPFESRAVERFVTMVRLHQARPVVLVRYEREPWESVIDDYARVTFDTRIRSQKAEAIGFEVEERGWRASDHPLGVASSESPVVLELKFTTAVPLWMVNMVRTLNLSRRAFSKYGLSARAWNEETFSMRNLSGLGGRWWTN